mmetsp:Transcript_2117/g.4841  ORF Transcript_2117/g.4841 Transcript_2117/m.4841 type:complete len:371 (+) Transcript_2117:63-1175(+)
MPASRAQVEVQSPTDAGDAVLGEASPGLAAEDVERSREDFYDSLVREVTDAVCEHVDAKTASAVDGLWQRGQQAILRLQEQQLTQTMEFPGQLAQCAEAHRQLERENAALRACLEEVIQQITHTFGPSAFLPTPSYGPGVAPGMPRAPAFHRAPQSPQKDPTFEARNGLRDCTIRRPEAQDYFSVPELGRGPLGMAGRSHLDMPWGFGGLPGGLPGGFGGLPPGFGGHPERGPRLSDPAAAVAAGGGAGGTAQPTGIPAAGAIGQQAGTFTFTLRLAENVGLGLEFQGTTGVEALTVMEVTSDGAVEAWNRQCTGDSREIRRGDQIVRINAAEDAVAMHAECNSKRVLRITVKRGTGEGAGASNAMAEVC